MANPIDLIITQAALKVVDDAIAKVNLLDKTMQEATQHFIDNAKKMTSATPSSVNGNAENNAATTAQLKSQANTIAELGKELAILNDKLTKLNATKTAGKKLTADEIVQNQAERRAAIELAKANSDLIGSYDKLNIKHQQAVRNAQNLGATYGQTSKQFKDAAAAANVLDKELKDIDSTLGRSQRNVGNYRSAFNSLGSVFGALGISTGLVGIVSLGKDIFETTKEIESLDKALKQVTQTNALFAQSQAFLARVSDDYGVNINDLTKQFTQFYVSAKDKISGREIEQIFESITKAGSSIGLSQQQQERAFLALNQMMSKGTIQAEELRGQLGEALPGALGIMAKALNVTEKQLGQMMKDGQLLAADVLPKFAKQLEITYGIEQVKRIDTLTASQNRLKNSWIEFVRTLNESEDGGINQFFSNILKGANFLLEGLININKSLKMIRGEFTKDATASQLEYLNAIEDVNERQVYANLTKKDAIKIIKEENELLAQAKHQYELLNKVSVLNFAPSRQKARIEAQKDIEKYNASLGTQKGRLLAAQQVLDEINAKPKTPDAKELTKAELKAIEDGLKAAAQLRRKELELQLANIDVKLNNEELYYTERLGALDKDFLKRTEIAKLDYDEEFRLAKGNQDKQKTALINFQIEKLKLIENYNKQRTQLEALDLNAVTSFDPDKKGKTDTDPFKYVTESAGRTVKRLQDFADASDALKKKIAQLRIETQNWLGSFSGEFLQKSGFGSLETFFDGTFKNLLEGAKNSKEEFAVYFNAIAESAQEAFNFISNASQQNFDSERERLQNQYDIALTYAGANKAAQEKLATDLEKQKKDIANRENKAKQKQAIFNIAVDTAQAIIGLWAKPGFPAAVPLAIAVGALGAAQIALVANQKIPQYWMGGTHDGGLMMVNDGKGSSFQETIVTPDGKVMKPQGRNVIMDAPKGTEIYTSDQWNDKLTEMLQGKGISMSLPQNNYSGISKVDMRDAMLEAIGEQAQYHTNFDANGVVTYINKKGNITKSASNRGNSIKTRFS